MLHYILLVSLKHHVIDEVYKEQKGLSNETQEDLLDTGRTQTTVGWTECRSRVTSTLHGKVHGGDLEEKCREVTCTRDG